MTNKFSGFTEPSEADRARGDFGLGFAATAQPYAEDQRPATPTPGRFGYVHDFGLETALYVPPAAPEPCHQCDMGVCSAHQPAAPEPSADPEFDDYIALPEPERREVGVVVPRAELARLRSAEAKLAAVRALMTGHSVSVGALSRALLTPVPSTDAGDEEGHALFHCARASHPDCRLCNPSPGSGEKR